MNSALRHFFCLLVSAQCATATVLTFDIAGITNFQNVPQNYGDNVTSATIGGFTYGTAQGFTPNVTVAYGNSDPALWTTGYGDLTNVLFEDTDGSGVLNITLTAETGFLVQLHSFDLGAFSTAFSSDPTITSVKVFNSLNVELFSQSSAPISESTHTPFTFATPLADASLRIEVDARNLGSLNDDIAADNVTFSQVVPEPGSLLLLATALPLVLARRCKRERSQA